MPDHGALKVKWYPQVPCAAFEVTVQTLVEARLLLHALAQYDLFQLKHHIKPDFSNAGDLVIFDSKDEETPGGDWITWYSDEDEDIEYYTLEELRQAEPVWEMAGREDQG
jgi:hypothetical protein